MVNVIKMKYETWFQYRQNWNVPNSWETRSKLNMPAVWLQVGSRAVIIVSGVLMISMGVLGKIGAVFTTIPTPVVGGMIFIMFGVITAAGISNLQVKCSVNGYFKCLLCMNPTSRFSSPLKCFVLVLVAKMPHFTVCRHEHLQEPLHLWFLPVLCTCHSKLDQQTSWIPCYWYNGAITLREYWLWSPLNEHLRVTVCYCY